MTNVMNMKLVSKKLRGLGLAALLVGVAASALAQTYSVIDLGTLPGWSNSYANGVNRVIFPGGNLNSLARIYANTNDTNWYSPACVGLPLRNRSRSSASAAAVAYRLAGAFSRHLRQMACRSEDTLGRHRRGGTISDATTWRNVSRSVSP